MVATWVRNPTDVIENCAFSLPPRFPTVAPDQLCLDGFEERLSHGIIIAFAFAAHRDLEAMLG
jgi:hypothetical protein|tara:strand:+ start:4117 stop:4305 length:189 start_codon:yes stop_codon:yes gene_type:complete